MDNLVSNSHAITTKKYVSKRHLLALLFMFTLPFSPFIQADSPDVSVNLITAGGTVTEIVFALGAGEHVVAVDQSSQYPAQARKRPMVGYYRDLSAEGVLSFLPDKLLTITGAGRPEVLQQIASTGVTVIQYQKPTSVNALLKLIARLGQELDKAPEATLLINQLRNTLPEIATRTTGTAVFLLSASQRGLIAAGEDTVPHLLFNYAGIQNLAAHHAGFKAINAESLTMRQPDFIVAPAHVVAGVGGKNRFCRNPNLALMQAAKDCRLLVMDSLMSLGMTTRLAEAIAIVKQFHVSNSKPSSLLYQDLSAHNQGQTEHE